MGRAFKKKKTTNNSLKNPNNSSLRKKEGIWRKSPPALSPRQMEARVASQAQRPYPNSPLGRRSPPSPARPRPRRIPRRRVPPPKSAAAGAQTQTTVPPPPAPATKLLDAPSRRPLSASGAPRSPVGQRDRNPGPPAALRSWARPAPAVCPAPPARTPAPSSEPPGSARPGSQPPAGPRARDEVWLRRGSGSSPGRVREGAPQHLRGTGSSRRGSPAVLGLRWRLGADWGCLPDPPPSPPPLAFCSRSRDNAAATDREA